MAEYRTVKTAMWREDDWFLDLPLDARLFWIYLFSNPSASVAGIYRLSLRTMANESGLCQERITELLALFAHDKKAHFADGVIWVVKMREHQGSDSPLVQKRIKKDIALIPNDNPVYRMYATQYGIDRVSIPITTTRHRDETETTRDETPQDKGINQEDSLPAPSSVVVGLSDVVRAYESNIGIIDYRTGEELKDLSKEFDTTWIVEAVKLAQGKRRPISYIRTVLDNWRKGDGAPATNGKGPKQTMLPPGFTLPPLPPVTFGSHG
jgi:hypothetical protein